MKAEQSKAAVELLRHDTGILAATTAFGKTVIGAWMIAARGVSTLVLVHRIQLLEQWKAQLALFLTVPADEIGQWGGGKNSRTGRLDIAMLQSVHGREDLPAVLGEYGQIIVDECHHISAFSFEQVLSRARSKYVLAGIDRDLRAQGRTSSDRQHAMRPGTLPRGCKDAGEKPAVPACLAAALNRLQHSRSRSSRFVDPGALRSVDCRRAPQRSNL